jgi:alkylation response protein AidB-like acyl-CoA dehydrogenase
MGFAQAHLGEVRGYRPSLLLGMTFQLVDLRLSTVEFPIGVNSQLALYFKENRMDLDFTEEQQLLRETVRNLCERHVSLAVVRQLEDDPVGFTEDFWKQLGELGLLGILVPEEYGGSGLTMLDAAVVYEEIGRALAPSPHFSSCVLGAGTLLTSGSEEQQRELLPKIASGEIIATPAWLEPQGSYNPKGVQLRAAVQGDEYILSGVKRHVPFANSATHLLVLARTGSHDSDIDILLVDPKSPGIEMQQQMALGSDTQYRVEFKDVGVPAVQRLGAPQSGWLTWDTVMHDAAILAAAQAAGGAERALEMTVEYSKDRYQFDKPLAAFQALSHYMADASTTVDGSKTLVYEAAWARSEGRSVRRLAPMAKLFACQTFRDVTAMALQIHGGMGFSVEYDIQLYFRRAKQLQLNWWDSRCLEERIAADVLDSEEEQPARA